MGTLMNRLYDIINARVKEAIDRPLTAENYQTYLLPLWLDTAEALKKEFEAEGLTYTVAEVEKIIADQARYKEALT